MSVPGPLNLVLLAKNKFPFRPISSHFIVHWFSINTAAAGLRVAGVLEPFPGQLPWGKGRIHPGQVFILLQEEIKIKKKKPESLSQSDL